LSQQTQGPIGFVKKRILSDRVVAVITNICARLLIWALAVTIAIVPAIHVSGVGASPFHFQNMALAIYNSNSNGFSHFYFVIIIMSVLGLSNIVDNVFLRYGAAHSWIKLIGVIGAFLFIMVLVIGMLNYAAIKPGPHDNLDVFTSYYATVLWVLGGGAFVEMCIALARTGENS
jgi:hypothetical protein